MDANKLNTGEKVARAREEMWPRGWAARDLAAALAQAKALNLDEDAWFNRIKNNEARGSFPAEQITEIAKVTGIEERWFTETTDTPPRWLNRSTSARPVERPSSMGISKVPYWGFVPCGDWAGPESRDDDRIVLTEEIRDRRGVIVVRCEGHSMEPRFRPGTFVAIRQSTTELNNTVVLARNDDNELSLKLMKRVNGQWTLQSLNPEFGEAKADRWVKIGHAIHAWETDESGLGE